MFDIDKVMLRICDAGATAMTRYAEVSGEAPDDLPEYFMSSFIFSKIGNDIGATLETGFIKLSEWNDDVRILRQLFPRSAEDKARFLALQEGSRRPRIDMALFQSENPDAPRGEWEFLALVEFKKGEFSIDRQRLLGILSHIDTCPYGVTCGSISGDANLEFHRNESQKSNDVRWYQSAPLFQNDRTYFFCARLFERPAMP